MEALAKMCAPLVSVIIPCYNCEKYLMEAIDSIITQTYKHLEIIIINDGSTDNTVSIINDLIKKDSRIVYIDNHQNIGLIASLNKGIASATGKYIARMDSDDVSLSNRIDMQVRYMEEHPKIAVCGTNSIIINENGDVIEKSHLPISESDNRCFMAFSSTLYHPTVMIRTECIKEELYDEKFKYAEDYELWCRMIFSRSENVVNLPDYLFKYRKVGSSVSSQNTDAQWRTSAKVFDYYNIVPEEYRELHKQLFFLRDKMKISLKMKKYVAKVMNQIKGYSFELQFVVIEKIAFYILKQKDYGFFLYMCTRQGFIKTCIKNRVKKMKKW